MADCLVSRWINMATTTNMQICTKMHDVEYSNFPGGNTPGPPWWEGATPSRTYPQHRGGGQAPPGQDTDHLLVPTMLNTSRRPLVEAWQTAGQARGHICQLHRLGVWCYQRGMRNSWPQTVLLYRFVMGFGWLLWVTQTDAWVQAAL